MFHAVKDIYVLVGRSEAFSFGKGEERQATESDSIFCESSRGGFC